MELPIITVFVDSNGTHLQQIYSGLFLLAQQKKIHLKYAKGTGITKNSPNRQFLLLGMQKTRGSKQVTCLFDLQDSPEIGLKEAISQVDYYFKRSLEKQTISDLSAQEQKKLQPFGLNFQVLDSSFFDLLQRSLLEYISKPYNIFSKKNRFHILNTIDMFRSLFSNSGMLLSSYDFDELESYAKGYVLFQCRLWDPDTTLAENRADTVKINESRCALIIELKHELGDRFKGGIQPTDYARKVCPELITEFPSKRRSYLKLVQQASIVINSKGLLNSNGWKLGEYIALNKVIVSEAIETRLRGNFLKSEAYLKCNKNEDFIRKIKLLLIDKERLKKVENSTQQYYSNYLRADALMSSIISDVIYNKSSYTDVETEGGDRK